MTSRDTVGLEHYQKTVATVLRLAQHVVDSVDAARPWGDILPSIRALQKALQAHYDALHAAAQTSAPPLMPTPP